MASSDPHGLGYHDVDGDAHTAVLVANMDATAGWEATMRLRAWERQHLESDAVSQFVEEIHGAARQQRFEMSLTMYALIAVRP